MLVLFAALVSLHTSYAYGMGAVPVYGFLGAETALISGRSLHYLVNLTTCTLTEGPNPAELADPFGGVVDTYRTFNDRNIGPPFMEFYEQRLTYNSTGRLAEVSRKVKIWQNNSVEVITTVYTPDFSVMTYMTSHICTMSTADTKGSVDALQGDAHEHILSYDALVESFTHAQYVHFNAMVFLCMGGKEHTFSSFGGRLTNFEVMMDGGVQYLESSVKHTVHYLPENDRHVMDVINMRVYENKTVAITDARGSPPTLDPVTEHSSFCFMMTGMPGGTVQFYAST